MCIQLKYKLQIKNEFIPDKLKLNFAIFISIAIQSLLIIY